MTLVLLSKHCMAAMAVTITFVCGLPSISHAQSAPTRLSSSLTQNAKRGMDRGLVCVRSAADAATNPYHLDSSQLKDSVIPPQKFALLRQAGEEPTTMEQGCFVKQPLTADQRCLSMTFPGACNTTGTPVACYSFGSQCTTGNSNCQTVSPQECYTMAGSACTSAGMCTAGNFCYNRTYIPACGNATFSAVGCVGHGTSSSQFCMPFTSQQGDCSTTGPFCDHLTSGGGSCSKSYSNSTDCDVTYSMDCMSTYGSPPGCTVVGVCEETYGRNCITSTSKGFCKPIGDDENLGIQGPQYCLALTVLLFCLAPLAVKSY